MTAPSEERRLAAIMFTDILGYSAIAQRNDAFAPELLDENRKVLRSIFSRRRRTVSKNGAQAR